MTLDCERKTSAESLTGRKRANKYRKDVYKYSGKKLVLVKSIVKTYQ